MGSTHPVWASLLRCQTLQACTCVRCAKVGWPCPAPITPPSQSRSRHPRRSCALRCKCLSDNCLDTTPAPPPDSEGRDNCQKRPCFARRTSSRKPTTECFGRSTRCFGSTSSRFGRHDCVVGVRDRVEGVQGNVSGPFHRPVHNRRSQTAACDMLQRQRRASCPIPAEATRW